MKYLQLLSSITFINYNWLFTFENRTADWQSQQGAEITNKSTVVFKDVGSPSTFKQFYCGIIYISQNPLILNVQINDF